MSTEPFTPDSRELPEPSATLFLIAAGLRVHETDHPGFIDRMVVELEDARLHAEIIRLRGPRQAKEVRRCLAEATEWAIAARAINAVTPGAARKRSWWEFWR